jgi:hypothetical protein
MEEIQYSIQSSLTVEDMLNWFKKVIERSPELLPVAEFSKCDSTKVEPEKEYLSYNLIKTSKAFLSRVSDGFIGKENVTERNFEGCSNSDYDHKISISVATGHNLGEPPQMPIKSLVEAIFYEYNTCLKVLKEAAEEFSNGRPYKIYQIKSWESATNVGLEMTVSVARVVLHNTFQVVYEKVS